MFLFFIITNNNDFILIDISLKLISKDKVNGKCENKNEK